MRTIANFYTLFWIIYFPTCIAFNNLPGFSSIDEGMTFLMIAFTFLVKGNHYGQNIKPWREYFIFLSILAFYIIYSLIWGENVAGGIYLEFLQQIRPYSLIYCTWILNPHLSSRQKKYMAYSVVVTLFVRMLIGGNEYNIGKIDLATGQLAICAGMSWVLFMHNTYINKYIAIFLVLSGFIIATRSKFIAEAICFIAIFYFMKNKIKIKSPKMFFSAVFVCVVVLYFVWEKFNVYYVEGLEEDIARSVSLRTAFGKIIWDYVPFGPGMGTFASNGAWKFYSPLYYKYELNNIWGLDPGGGFICDVFYASLAQYGFVGIFLFIWFWKRRLANIDDISSLPHYKVALMAFLCLAIEQMADSSILSGKGMGYCMLIGLCLNFNKNQIHG